MPTKRRKPDAGSPSTDGSNGRGHDGRFAPGNRYGKGNPHALDAARLREELFAGIRKGDIRAIVAALVKKAKKGDVIAAKEVLDRLIGRPLVHAEIANVTEREISLPDDYLRFLDWVADQEGKALPQ